MDKIYRVFISSTYEDLIEERKEVTQALLEMDCFPTGMELFQASNDAQWELIKRVIDSCDYYIVIIAGRYGSVHEETKKSYTQMEYEYAVKSGIPVLGFIRKDLPSLPHNKVDDLSKVKQFIKIVKQKEVKYWSTPHELAGVVSRAIHHAMENYPRMGWVRDTSKSREADIINMVRRILNNEKDTSNMVVTGGEIHEEAIVKESKPQVRQAMTRIQENNLNKISISAEDHAEPSTISFSGSFLLDSMKSSALKETANIILSEGLTAFSNIFEKPVFVGFPSYSLCPDYNSLHDKLTEVKQVSVINDIWSNCVAGCIAMSMPTEFLIRSYIYYVKRFSLKIPSKKEVDEFRKSMATEFGSIFTGACSTSISLCTHTTVRMSPSSFSSVEELFNSSAPVYVAELPFRLEEGPPFKSYLLLNIESLKAILYTDDTYASPFDKSSSIQKPSHWIK